MSNLVSGLGGAGGKTAKQSEAGMAKSLADLSHPPQSIGSTVPSEGFGVRRLAPMQIPRPGDITILGQR